MLHTRLNNNPMGNSQEENTSMGLSAKENVENMLEIQQFKHQIPTLESV